MAARWSIIPDAGKRAGTHPTLAWTPDSGGGTLTITSSDDQQHLHFAGASLSASSFKLASDTHGGTLITHG